MSTTLLGHASTRTGDKHYNQARMIDASRRYGTTISAIREAMLPVPDAEGRIRRQQMIGQSGRPCE